MVGLGYGPSRLKLGTHQQIECGEVRNHQHGHVDDRDSVGGPELPRQGRKVELDAVVIIDDDVDRACEIERDDKGQKTERIRTVRSAIMASNPVAKSP